jgi:hypothetical protein
VWHGYRLALASYWLRAVPFALRARGFGSGLAALAILAALAPGLGCSAVKAGASGEPTTFEPDGNGGASGGSTGLDAASSCHASDVSAYVPATYQSAVAPSAACLGADGGETWDAFFDACLGPDKSKTSCDAFTATPSNAACAACVLTSYTSSRLGPIVDYGDFVGGNVAGCIELTTPADLPCAEEVQALTNCEIAACEANCPVSDEASLAARESCSSSVDAVGCYSFNQSASSCRAAEVDAGVANPCMDGAFKDFYEAVVPFFCGRTALDASAVFDASASGDAAVTSEIDGEPGDAGVPFAAAVDAAGE